MEAWTCKRAEERKEGRVWSAKRPRWILDGEFTWERQGGDEGDVWFELQGRPCGTREGAPAADGIEPKRGGLNV